MGVVVSRVKPLATAPPGAPPIRLCRESGARNAGPAALTVAREHDHTQARAVEGADRLRSAVLDWIGDPDNPARAPSIATNRTVCPSVRTFSLRAARPEASTLRLATSAWFPNATSASWFLRTHFRVHRTGVDPGRNRPPLGCRCCS